MIMLQEKTTEKTTEKIIRLIKESPTITTTKLAEECGISIDGIDWQIRKLRKMGYLLREDGDNGRHWVILCDTQK